MASQMSYRRVQIEKLAGREDIQVGWDVVARGQHRRAPDGLWAKNQVRPAASPLPAGSEDQNAVAPNGLEVAYMHGEGCSEYTAGGVVVGPLGGSESVETDLLRRSIDG